MLGNGGHENPNRQASQGIPVPPPPCPSASSSFLTWHSLWALAAVLAKGGENQQAASSETTHVRLREPRLPLSLKT